MEINDSPKSLKYRDKAFENTEDVIITVSEQKKQKKFKRKNKYKKNLKISDRTINNLELLNYNNNFETTNFNLYKSNNRFYKFVGKTLFLFMDKHDNPLLIIGPHWPLFACFFGTMNILYFIIIFKLWKKFGTYGKLINQISYWLFTLSYAYTSLINPGYPKNNQERRNGNPREEYYLCGECQFYVKKNKGVSHCDDCGICIEEHDHHCPWTSHCIGKNNIISFYIFIISTLFSICYLPLAFCQFLT
jgi:hypothetical protein